MLFIIDQSLKRTTLFSAVDATKIVMWRRNLNFRRWWSKKSLMGIWDIDNYDLFEYQMIWLVKKWRDTKFFEVDIHSVVHCSSMRIILSGDYVD